MSLLIALFSVTATCTPNPAHQPGPERVRAYFAAVNARDEAAIGAFLKPGATYSNPQIPGMSLAEVMSMLLAEPRAEQLEVVEATERDDRIFVRTRTPSGSTAAASVRLDRGCISEFVQTQ